MALGNEIEDIQMKDASSLKTTHKQLCEIAEILYS